MNKGIRFIIVGILLMGVLFLAGNQIASAGNLPWQSSVVVQGQSASVLLDPNNRPGTVKPPPVVVPPITKPGTYSVGGVCTLYVEQLAENVNLYAKLLPFDVLNKRPDNISRYLAGVCDLTYHVSGKPAANLTPDEGTVKICFAALPKIKSKIYVYDNKAWTALDTTLDETTKLECAVASKTGRYILAASQP